MRATRSLWSDRKSQEKVMDRENQEREKKRRRRRRRRERERVGREIEGDEERQQPRRESGLECGQGIQVPYPYGITTRAFCAWWMGGLGGCRD